MSSSKESVNSQTGYHTISPSDAETLLGGLPDHPSIQKLARDFQLLSDPTRLQILMLLEQQELCVHDLSTLLEKSSSAVSHQLRELRNQELVRRRKDGRVVYYTLNGERVSSVIQSRLAGLIPPAPPSDGA